MKLLWTLYYAGITVVLFGIVWMVFAVATHR